MIYNGILKSNLKSSSNSPAT